MTTHEPILLSPWRGGLVPLPEPVTPGMSVQNSWVHVEQVQRQSLLASSRDPKGKKASSLKTSNQTRPPDILVSL